MSRRIRSGLAFAGPLLVLSILTSGTGALAQSASPAPDAAAPTLADPDVTGTELVTQYVQLIKDGDGAGLAAFITPGFQIARANGDHYERDAYLAEGLPTIESFTISDVDATQAGPVLVVYWMLDSTEIVDGDSEPSGPLPRLTTFAWIDSGWKLVAHANFGAGRGTEAPLPSASPAG